MSETPSQHFHWCCTFNEPRLPPNGVCDCGYEQNFAALGGLDGPEVGKHFDAMARQTVDKDGDSDEN